jgi:phosphohistidine phosphatase
MRLYLIQHGEAVAKDIDPDRPLSAMGRQDIQRLANFLAHKRVRVARILHSGKTRARETAEVLALAIGAEGKIERAAGLDPLDSASEFSTRLKGGSEDFAIVGHLPFLAKLVAFLVTGHDEPALVAFVPGTVVVLERNDAGVWMMTTMLQPHML